MFQFYGLSDVVAGSTTTANASSVTTSSMVCNGSFNSGGDTSTTYGFYFGTNSSYSSNSKIQVGTGDSQSYTLSRTGLSAGTTYYITAYSINSIGETVGSTVSQATSFNYSSVNFRVQQYNSYGYLYYYRYSTSSFAYRGSFAPSYDCNDNNTGGSGTYCTTTYTNTQNRMTTPRCSNCVNGEGNYGYSSSNCGSPYHSSPNFYLGPAYVCSGYTSSYTWTSS